MALEPPASDQLTAILLQGHESKELDYKGPMAWDEATKKICCGLVKDILAMANTLGGFIVIGVSEQPTGYSFEGVIADQAKSFDTSRVNRFLQAYADPPINTVLRKLNHGGKVFVIIEVPAFSDTPHICQKDFPEVLSSSTLYVRTDNNESAPIRLASGFKTIVERAVRNRSDALLAAFRSILNSGTTQAEPSARDQFLTQRGEAEARFQSVNPLKHEEPLLGYLETSFTPERFEPSRFSLEALRAAAERAHVTYTGWPFLFIHHGRPDATYVIQDGWETFIQTKDFGGHYLMDFWRLQQSGFFYHGTILRPSARQVGTNRLPVADLQFIAIYVAQGIDCLTRLYDGLLEDSESISLDLRILNAEGRVLVSPEGTMPLFDAYVCRIPEITVGRRLPLADWRAAVVEHAVSITNESYLRFNWPQPNIDAARNAIQRMFARRW
jgi:hypothetical protein